MKQKQQRPSTKATQDLLALIRAAQERGFAVHFDARVSDWASAWLTVDDWVARMPQAAGSFSISVVGPYAGDRSAYGLTGVAIDLAASLGWDVSRFAGMTHYLCKPQERAALFANAAEQIEKREAARRSMESP